MSLSTPEPPPDEWSALFGALPIGAFRSTPGARLLRASTALAHRAGYESGEELMSAVNDQGMCWYAAPGRQPELLALLEREAAVPSLMSEVNHRAAGRTVWVSENAHVVRREDGRVAY